MSQINEATMKDISAKIFKISEMYPGRVKIIDTRNTDSDITKKYGKKFEGSFSIDDSAILKKIEEIVNRPYGNYAWVMVNPILLKYDLYS